MILPIDNSRPINQNNSRFFIQFRNPIVLCSNKPFCSSNSTSSYINKNNKIYFKNNILTTQATSKNNYPNYLLFGAEHTIQSIYSADPLKLRIGAY